MTITNLTEDGKKISLDRLQCSVDLTSNIKYHLLVVVVLNILMSVTAFVDNTIILVALHKEYQGVSSSWSGHK